MAKDERPQKYGFRGTVGNANRKSRFFTKKAMPPQPTPEQFAQPGVMEQIFFGPYTPSGFNGILDGYQTK